MLNPINTVTYTIQANDTFYRISKYFNVTLDDLIEVNPDINPDNLEAGQIINVPLAPPFFNCPSISDIYTIQHGDTMYNIAQKHKIKLNTLVKSNPHINPEAPIAGQSICIPKPWNTYHSERYKIEFKYPVRWAKVNDTFYEGLDGFFRVSVINSSASLMDICEQEAYHKLKPYGSHPHILRTEASGESACLVLPSNDQPMEMNGQSALILKYPTPILMNGAEFNHFILWADSLHIKDIKETLILLNQHIL